MRGLIGLRSQFKSGIDYSATSSAAAGVSTAAESFAQHSVLVESFVQASVVSVVHSVEVVSSAFVSLDALEPQDANVTVANTAKAKTSFFILLKIKLYDYILKTLQSYLLFQYVVSLMVLFFYKKLKYSIFYPQIGVLTHIIYNFVGYLISYDRLKCF